MSEILKAADDIVTYASRIRSFLEVADVLRRIGNLEQAENHANAKAEKARGDAEIAVRILAEKDALIAKANDEIEYAKKSADEIISNARNRAVSILDEASIKANESLRITLGKKDSVEHSLLELKSKYDSLIGAISDKEAVLHAINEKIKETKERIASLSK